MKITCDYATVTPGKGFVIVDLKGVRLDAVIQEAARLMNSWFYMGEAQPCNGAIIEIHGVDGIRQYHTDDYELLAFTFWRYI